MKLSEVMNLLGATLLTGSLETNVLTACGSDLMSDVLIFAKERGLLITGLINPQVIRTADMMDIIAIVFVRGKTPPQDVIELAEEYGMTVLTTKHPMYKSCGLLFSNGLDGSTCAAERQEGR